MADGYYLNEDDVRILRRMADAYRRGEHIEQKGEGLPPIPDRAPICWGVPRGTVYGTCIGQDPNPETLDLYKFTSTGGTTPTGSYVRIYNLGPTDCTTDGFLIAHRDQRTSRWITAGTGGSASTMKPYIDFILDTGLNTTSASATALITNQFGPGTAHSTTSTVTVLQGPGDMYFGSSGTYGQAVWNTSRQFKIFQLVRTCTT